MSTQVLARKWRPKTFEQVVGQEHVIRALTHALDAKRLHHAYLFTGTRGVGKTTLSRLLAKALNCTGADGHGDITAHPCGVCAACAAIDRGRFIDYIEMDAASNRGVDEMAALLEQAVYSPSDARFKVYMIDEVHMLTGHAFNAMLKTLEEPPEHLKFILATTDPQKIPVTVLSRCLQFNLKQMPASQLVSHLAHILSAEQITFEPAALPRLARAAQGSMRDALSLTDQAIAYSAGAITDAAVQSMLGSLDETYIVRLLDALLAQDGAELLAIADEIWQRSLSMSSALQDLALALQRIALIQSVPTVQSDDWPASEDLQRLAKRYSAEEVQLDYEIAIRGRADLALAPDDYAGFTMTLMRMLAFAPEGTATPQERAPTDTGLSSATASHRAAAPARSTAAAQAHEGGAAQSSEPALEGNGSNQAGRAGAAPAALSSAAQAIDFDGDWLKLVAAVKVSGLTRQLLEQAELIRYDAAQFDLRVGVKGLADRSTVEKLKAALSGHFGRPVNVVVEVGTVAGQTRAQLDKTERDARQARAVMAIEADPFVKTLVSAFDAVIVPGSIRPL